MKFLCDRCKTRYSIGDDRVRGKILKIRCKNCANVITVREGMTDAEAASEAEAPRRGRPTTAAPIAQATAAIGSALKGKGAKPPAALEEEWYVSIDGDQSGPYSLTEAQRWISGKPFDADLHCWSEGFDDWLPVDKVSHFRGLRRKPAPPSTPPPIPRQKAEEPKPLFAATMASIEKAAQPEKGLGLPPIAGTPKPASSSTPSAAHAKANGSALPKPASVPAPMASIAQPRTATSQGLGLKSSAAPLSAGAQALAEAFDVRNGVQEPQDSLTAVETPAFMDEMATTTAEPMVVKRLVEQSAVDAASTMPFGPPASAMAMSPPAAPSADTEDDDPDSLNFGEVSRVVKLADLAKMGSPKRTASRAPNAAVARTTGPNAALRATGPAAALRGATGSTPKINPAELAMGAGLAPPVDPNGMPVPGAEVGPGESLIAAPVVARAHRRGLIMLISVAGVLLLSVIGAVVFIVSGGSDDLPLGLGGTREIDTSRPEDTLHPKTPADLLPGPGSAVVKPTRRWPNPNIQNRPGSAGSAEDPLPGNTLKAEEIEDMAAKQSSGTQRCYMRAQKGVEGITIGDVKKISVTMTIDKDGTVSDVQLSDHGADSLGKCLSGLIKRWKFRQSSGGTFKIVLAFASG